MDPFKNVNPSHVSDFTRTDDAGSQQQQTDQARFQEHLNALPPGQHRQAVPNSRLARRRTGSNADAVGPSMLQEEDAAEGGSHLPFAPPAHSPAQSFDQDELFAAADRAGPFAAASFASEQFWQDAERGVHSPAQSVDQPRSRAAIGVGYEASSSMPPPGVNLPATGFGSAPDGVSFPHVVADAYRPAANQQGDLTGARHTMPAAAPHQAAVIQQTRSRKRGREHPDEALFAAYRAKADKTAKVSEGSIARGITALRKFSTWLDENHQSQIHGRVEDEQLDGLAKDFAGNDAKLLGDTNVALGRLRQHSAGQPVTAASNVRPGTKDDEELFAQYRAKAVVKAPTVRGDLAALRKFSRWLDENHRTQIAGRIEDPGLDALAKDFAVRESTRINPALKRLREHSVRQPVTAASNVRPVTKHDEELFAQAAGLKEGSMGGDLTGPRHTMPAAAPHQAAVIQQTRSRKRGLEHPDEALFAAYGAQATTKVSKKSIARDITALRKFSTWLDENHQSQIDGRIDDEQLDGLAKDFAGNDAKLLGQLKMALGRLRQHSAGQLVTAASIVRPGTKDDEELFAQYRAEAVGSLKETTVRGDITALRKFSTWLDENHQSQIHGRIEDEQLDGLAKNFAGNDAVLLSDINVALGRLRQHSAGQTVTTARSRPVSEDNQVIEDACQAATGRYGKDTLNSYRSTLGRFNSWLSQNFGEGIAQIEPAVLSRAVDEYKKNAGPRFATAWGFLQRYRQMVAANNALGLSAHGQAAPRERPSGPAMGTAQSASPVAFSPIPMSPSDPAWDVLRAFHEEEAVQRGAPMAANVPQFHQTTSLPPELVPVPAPSSPAQSADSSSTFAGLAPLSPIPYRRPDFDLNALTPEQLTEGADISGSGHWSAVAGPAIAQPGSSRRSSQIYAGLDDIVDLQDDAGSAPRPDAARSRSIAGPSPSSSVPGEGSAASSAAHGRLPDLGPQLGSREQADLGVRPAASQESYDQSQLWQEVDQAGRQRPAGRDRPCSGWSPQSDQDMGPARRSTSARSSDIYRGLDSIVDLPSTSAELRDDAHYAPPLGTASDAQVEALNPRASSHDRSGLALDATQWLSDEHIQRDYELLAQQLQRENSDLAARTRLVDPLIAHYHLRLGSDNAALRAFQRIVYDRNGNDASDFLFLPVNDASATDPERRGSHWSLLLVDRRERERPVAYHYDSAGRHNSQPAAQLAQRLGARLEPVRMTQQQNGYDCGVFVLDGTRALVGRLGQRQQPARLHLDNLVIDRQALQHRLGHRAGTGVALPISQASDQARAELMAKLQ
ncbi:site-specific recombinase XerD [Mesorhizobium shonense]|uniref:Site-specific recombinase XerD n=1 Tax=Mesorhizobium shonense TaxID=1209948 RepID=A0ABV2I3Y9_9HYPH